jgi:hypothetical protein
VFASTIDGERPGPTLNARRDPSISTTQRMDGGKGGGRRGNADAIGTIGRGS